MNKLSLVKIELTGLGHEGFSLIEKRISSIFHPSRFGVETFLTENGIRFFLYFFTEESGETNVRKTIDREMNILSLFDGINVTTYQVVADAEEKTLRPIEILRLLVILELGLLENSEFGPRSHKNLLQSIFYSISKASKLSDFESIIASLRLSLAFSLPPAVSGRVTEDVFLWPHEARLILGLNESTVLPDPPAIPISGSALGEVTIPQRPEKSNDNRKLGLLLAIPPTWLLQFRAVNVNQVIEEGYQLIWLPNQITRFAVDLRRASKKKEFLFLFLEVDSTLNLQIIMNIFIKSGFLRESRFNFIEGYRVQLDTFKNDIFYSWWLKTKAGASLLGHEDFRTGNDAKYHGRIVKTQL